MFITMVVLIGVVTIVLLCSLVDDVVESFYTQYNEKDIKFHSFQEKINDEYDDTVRLVEDYEYFWN